MKQADENCLLAPQGFTKTSSCDQVTEVIRMKNRGTLPKTPTEEQMVVNTGKQSPKE